MTNEEKLYLAIGEIDDALIEEAGKDYVRKNFYTKKLIAIAASAAIVTIAVIGSSRLFNASLKNDMAGDAPGSFEPDMNTGNRPESSAPGMNGDDNTDNEAGSGESYVVIENINSTGLTLKLIIKSDLQSPADIHFYSADKSVVYSTAKETSESNLLRPTITVNGENAERLPYKTGEYEVTITFDGIDKLNIQWEKYLLIDGFNPIWLGNSFN